MATPEKWTADLEHAFQQLRKQRGSEPFADPNMEEAFQAAKRRRYETPPDAEMLAAQLREQQGG